MRKTRRPITIPPEERPAVLCECCGEPLSNARPGSTISGYGAFYYGDCTGAECCEQERFSRFLEMADEADAR